MQDESGRSPAGLLGRSSWPTALNQGIWVLCDRFSDSTRVYQGRLGQVAPAVLNAMERVTIGDLKPDLTIILDIPVEIGMQRAAARRGTGAPDRFEAEDVKFHQELRDAYRQIAAAEPQRCVLIDANADAGTVAASLAPGRLVGIVRLLSRHGPRQR